MELDIANKTDMILVVNSSRGYHLSISTLKFQSIPMQHQREFVQVSEKGGRTFCSTERIISLDTRQELAYHEIVLMAGRVIEEILEEIRERQSNNSDCAQGVGGAARYLSSHPPVRVLCLLDLNWLAEISESIAWLDLVCSFADLVTRSPHRWVRPELTMNGALVIEDGRHPLVQNATNEPMVPNDVEMDQTSNFRIVTGANGVSGERDEETNEAGERAFLYSALLPVHVCDSTERQEHVPAHDRRCLHPCTHWMLRARKLRVHSTHGSDSHASVARRHSPRGHRCCECQADGLCIA